MGNDPRGSAHGARAPGWVRVFWLAAALLLMAFAALHLTRHGFGHHGAMP